MTLRHGLLTHMHPDHIGSLSDLPLVTFRTSPQEYAAAVTEPSRLNRVRGHYFGGSERYRNVEPFEWAAGRDLEPFEAHCDLFGDGSIVALPTPSRTAPRPASPRRLATDMS